MVEYPDGTPIRSGEDAVERTTVPGPGGRRVEMFVLYASETPDRRVRILANATFMKAFLEYRKRMPGHVVTLEALRADIAEAGIVFGVHANCIRLAVELLNAEDNPDIGLFEIASGQRGHPGRDGTVEFIAQPTSRNARYETDESGNVDYRQLNLIENVYAGEEIAVYHPPTAGTPGRDLMGRTTPAPDGKPLHVRIGHGVREDTAKRRYYAAIDGRVVFDNNRISVSDKYEIHGDVDYGVGSIDFVGSVAVHGNVLDDFDIQGKQGVWISGDVGTCLLQSEGDIHVEGGMAGKGRGRIRAGGNVYARYFNDVTIEAYGDVSAQKEILNTRIAASGAVRIPEGAIVSGITTAFRGIEARVLGSDLGIHTKTAAGVDWTHEQQIDAVRARVTEMSWRVSCTDTVLEPLLTNKGALLALPADERDRIYDIIDALQTLRKELESATQELEALESHRPRERVCQVNVNHQVHPGVEIRFSQIRQVIKDPMRGPCSLIEDDAGGVVRAVAQFRLIPDEDPERPNRGAMRDVGNL